jgi:WhiB family redox-sensing transcriptional regulator
MSLPTDANPVCYGDQNAAYWFPEDFHYGAEQTATEYAKAGCKRCPFELKCAAVAIEKNERHGIWGGLTVDERDALVNGAVA